MCNPKTRRGVLNDFDLARICIKDEKGKPTGKDNTGTLPFMALDLLFPRAFQGMVPRLYRHDAESFAWCLIYICICVEKRGSTILIPSPHPLGSWFEIPQICRDSKIYETRGLFARVTLHKRCKPLAIRLFNHWIDRFQDQQRAEPMDTTDTDPDTPLEGLPARWLINSEPKERVYEEPSECESFKRVCRLLFGTSGAVPQSKANLFLEKMGLVTTTYTFLTSPGPAP